MSFNRASLFGFSFIDAASVGAVAADIMKRYERGMEGGADFLITPNASTVVYYNEGKHTALKDFYASAAYILPDGMPLVWLSRMKGKQKLQARLTGSDLFPVLWQEIKQKERRVTMVLASDGLASRYSDDYRNCNVFIPAFFNASDERYINDFAGEVADGIVTNKSGFVFLGLNFPKQELLGIAIVEALKDKGYKQQVLVLLLGASFEFYFGIKKRAPELFRKTGMEWLYRFISEPGRLWKRYTVDNVRFLYLAFKELLKK
ncbi:MAG: hypothetical protein BGO69_08525 [Bacteroidetes bacterium 46-16]|nr:MAG: hypothetical protein BGO69_08525 [Bacteroidetes bacterium 46-16]